MARGPMRPGTLVLIVLLLLAMLGFGLYLITYDGGRPQPGAAPSELDRLAAT